MKSTMQQLSQCSDVELQIVVGGAMNLRKYGIPTKIINKDGFHVNEEAYFLLEGGSPLTMAKSTGHAISEFANIFEKLKPDIVVAIADRFEALGVAIAASYMNIVVAHIEGGELSGSIDESIRHAITKLSHLHFVSTTVSAKRVRQMGEDPRRIHVVGSPNLDLLKEIDVSLSFDPFEENLGVGPLFPFVPNNYLVVLQHPVTTEYDSSFFYVQETLHAIHEIDIPTIWLWPNMDAGSDATSGGIRAFREQYNPQHIHFFKNFSFEDYARLINNCKVLVGNSSSGIRESSFLGVPVVNIGTRQHYRERGKNVIDASYNRENIKSAIIKQMEIGKYEPDYIYGNGNAGKIIAENLINFELEVQKQFIAYN